MDTFAMRSLIILLLVLVPGTAMSHIAQEGKGTTHFLSWSLDPWVIACMALSLFLYLRGVARLRPRSKQGHGVLRQQLVYFLCGWLALAAALVSPIDAWGGELFSAHMVQHELLMIVAAPLLVLSRPLGVWAWSLPRNWRLSLGSLTHAPAISASWAALTHPLSAWVLHTAALWLWHAPPFFQASLTSDAVHTFQHASFLLTALLFWWAVLGAARNVAPGGAAILYLFTTMMHTGALGALLTVSSVVWYPAYAPHTGAYGLTPIEDQQLGGLIMWIPGGLVYVLAGLTLCRRWLMREPGAFKQPYAAAELSSPKRKP
jgi:putative membrane protein